MVGPGVLGGRLVADLPGAVHLVADAPVPDAVRLREAVRRAQPASAPSAVGAVAVLHPVARLAHVAVAALTTRYGSAPSARQKPMNSLVPNVFGSMACQARSSGRAVLDRADAVPPAVAGHEVAARVADVGVAQSPGRLEHVRAQAVGVRQRRARLVDAAVDAPAQVLDEAAEDVAVDVPDALVEIDGDAIHLTSTPWTALGPETKPSDPKRNRVSRSIPLRTYDCMSGATSNGAVSAGRGGGRDVRIPVGPRSMETGQGPGGIAGQDRSIVGHGNWRGGPLTAPYNRMRTCRCRQSFQRERVDTARLDAATSLSASRRLTRPLSVATRVADTGEDEGRGTE